MKPEQQYATKLEDIRADHRARYTWAVMQLLNKKQGATVLDAACGCGYGSYMLAQAGLKVIGIDRDIRAHQFALHHWRHENNRFMKLDLEIDRSEIMGQPFDAVVSFETIEHLEQDCALLHTFRSCSPVLLGSVPNEEAIPFSKQAFPYHVRHYHQREIEAMLRAAGYSRITFWSQADKKAPVRLGVEGKPRTLVFYAED